MGETGDRCASGFRLTRKLCQIVQESGIELSSLWQLDRQSMDVLMRTVKEVRSNPQFEILLRTQQADNRVFDFLYPQAGALNSLYDLLAHQISEELFWTVFLDDPEDIIEDEPVNYQILFSRLKKSSGARVAMPQKSEGEKLSSKVVRLIGELVIDTDYKYYLRGSLDAESALNASELAEFKDSRLSH
jgi:hypothetical protein